MECAALGVRGILFSASLSSHCALFNARGQVCFVCVKPHENSLNYNKD